MRKVDMEERPLQWHYTSTAGLLGILASSSLWASHVATLNDSTEIRFGMDLVRSRLPTRLEDVQVWADLARARIDADVPAAVTGMLGLVEGSLMDGGLYVFCASLSGDSLSQWRGYGGNSTSGFAVGLRREALDYKWPGHVDLTMGDESASGGSLAMSLHPVWRDVIYDRVEQEAASWIVGPFSTPTLRACTGRCCEEVTGGRMNIRRCVTHFLGILDYYMGVALRGGNHR